MREAVKLSREAIGSPPIASSAQTPCLGRSFRTGVNVARAAGRPCLALGLLGIDELQVKVLSSFLRAGVDIGLFVAVAGVRVREPLLRTVDGIAGTILSQLQRCWRTWLPLEVEVLRHVVGFAIAVGER